MRLFSILLMISLLQVHKLNAQVTDYNCCIKNITQVSPDTLEFDIWVENVGTNTLKLTGLQCGINFNHAGMVNGGSLSPSVILGSPDPSLPSSQQNPTVQINATSLQFRVAAAVATPSTAAATIPPPPGIRIARFRITNTVPFTANSTPNFGWQFVSSSTTTKTALAAYVNSSSIAVDITIPAKHCVLGNPVLNPVLNPTSSVLQLGNGKDTLCIGETTNLKVNITGGQSPYTVVYTNGIQNDTVFNYISGSDIPINPTVTSAYSILSVTDAAGFIGTGNTGVALIVIKKNTNLALATNGNLNSIAGNRSVQNFIGDGNTQLYIDSICDRILTIKDYSGGTILGNTKVDLQIDASTQNFNGQPYAKRSFKVSPSNNNSVVSDLTLYLTQKDFEDYNISNGAFRDLPSNGSNSDLAIPNIRVMEVDENANITNFFLPTTVWNSIDNYWEIKVPITKFGTYYITSLNPDTLSQSANIVTFSGQKLATSDELFWTSSKEQDLSHYNLYYGTDGTNFTFLQKMFSKSANGSSNIPLNYKTYNYSPKLGHNYYKLEMVDKFGGTTFHPNIVDLIWGSNGNTITVYPNSQNNGFNVDLFTNYDQDISIKLIDMSGRTINVVKSIAIKGVNKFLVDMSGIANGVYSIMIFGNGDLIHNQKFLKNR